MNCKKEKLVFEKKTFKSPRKRNQKIFEKVLKFKPKNINKMI